MRLRTRSDIAAGIALTDNYTRTEPAWHDAPTCPGLWRNSITMKVERLEQWHIDAQMYFDDARWYGPIPEDRQ